MKKFLLNLVFCCLLIGCAHKQKANEPKQLTHTELAYKLYIRADYKSLESAFAFATNNTKLIHQEPVLKNMYTFFYSANRFQHFMVDFLENNFTVEELQQLINKFESADYNEFVPYLAREKFNLNSYQKFAKEFKQTERSIERAEMLSRILISTRTVENAHKVMNEMTMALKRTNYFIKYDHVPTPKMLLELKRLEENADQVPVKALFQDLFQEMLMSMLYSLEDMPDQLFYQIHNFFNDEQIYAMNSKLSKGIVAFLRETRLEYTKELMVFMAQKHSDRMPAANLKFKD